VLDYEQLSRRREKQGEHSPLRSSATFDNNLSPKPQSEAKEQRVMPNPSRVHNDEQGTYSHKVLHMEREREESITAPSVVMFDKVPSGLRRKLPNWNQGSTSEGEVGWVGWGWCGRRVAFEIAHGFWLAGGLCLCSWSVIYG